MSFRRRSLTHRRRRVAVLSLVGGRACYLAVRGQLRGQVDDSLRRQAPA